MSYKSSNELTPDQVHYCQIDSDAREKLAEQLDALIERLHSDFDKTLKEAALADKTLQTPPKDFFRAGALQHIFCRLCKADPKTFEGGNAEIGKPVVQNLQNIMGLWSE